MSNNQQAHIEYIQRLADNSLILGQRVAEWCGHSPVLEEDMALTNISLDLIGQARLLLQHVAKLEGKGRTEDQLAFLRIEPEFRNLTICELPNEDFARTMLRNFLFSTFQTVLFEKLESSKDSELAAIATKSLKEARYHASHSGEWVIRMGDGTDISHKKTQTALDYLWPYTNEFFAACPNDAVVKAANIGPSWAELEGEWRTRVEAVLSEATLAMPTTTPFKSYGKFGRHSEHMGHILSEMQYLQRAYPGGEW